MESAPVISQQGICPQTTIFLPAVRDSNMEFRGHVKLLVVEGVRE